MTAPGFDRAQWEHDTAEPPGWDDRCEACALPGVVTADGLCGECARERGDDLDDLREAAEMEQAERRADAESDPHWTPGDQP